MATEGTFQIGSDQPLTSVAAWEAAVTGPLTADYIGQCVNQEDDVNGGGITFDNAASPTAKYILEGVGAGKHSGIENTGYRLIGSFGSNRGLITIAGDFAGYMIIRDLELILESTTSAIVRHATASAANDGEFDCERCLIYSDRSGNNAVSTSNLFTVTSGGAWSNWSRAYFTNCHIRSIRGVGDNSSIHRARFCTSFGNTDGTPINDMHGFFGMQVNNCYGAYWGNGSTRFAYSNLAAGSSENASLDSSGDITGVPVNAVTSVTFPCDYHLNVANAGALLAAAQPIAGVTVDIDGDTRDAVTPDIGEDEAVAAGPAVSEVATGTPTDTELQNSQFRAQNGNGGTYWSRAFPGTVTPDHATIVAGTGAVGNLETGGLISDDQTVTVNHTGLTASTAYTRAATIEDSGSQASTPTYANFSTGAAAVRLRDLLFDVATGVEIPAGRTVEYAFWPAGSLATIGAPAAQGTTTTVDPAGGHNIDVDVSGIFNDTDEVTVLYREVVAGGTPPGSNDNWGSGSPVAAVLVFV